MKSYKHKTAKIWNLKSFQLGAMKKKKKLSVRASVVVHSDLRYFLLLARCSVSTFLAKYERCEGVDAFENNFINVILAMATSKGDENATSI